MKKNFFPKFQSHLNLCDIFPTLLDLRLHFHIDISVSFLKLICVFPAEIHFFFSMTGIVNNAAQTKL